MRTCTSVAPASRSIRTMQRLVVPRTIESSTMTTRLPSTILRTGDSFIFTPCSRSSCEGWMNVRPTYRFLIKPNSYGIPDCSAKPIAAEILESGTPVTTSASIGDSTASCFPRFLRAEWTLIPSILLSGLEK